MRYRRFTVYIFFIAGILILASFSANPPQGRTGAPDEKSCATSGCHSSSNPGINGEVVVEGLPRNIEAAQTYSLSVRLITIGGNPIRGGLQMTALDQDLINAGTFTNPGENSVVSEANSRMYFEHQPAKNFNGADEVVYNVDWTSPADLTSTAVAFYGAANFANGNGSASNDRIVTFSDTFMMTQSTLAVNIAATNISCNQANDGSLTAAGIGGAEPYTYEWSTDSDTPMIENLGADIYSVTVTDSDGNQVVGTATISEPELLTVSIDILNEPSCEISPGNLDAVATGGTGTYIYQWSNGIGTANNDNIEAGTYTVSILDENGCIAESSVILTGRDLIAPVIQVDSVVLFSLTSDKTVFDLIFDQIDNGSSDNCGAIMAVFNKMSFDCSDVGSSMVILTLTDGSGNSSQKIVIVNVEDVEVPTIFCIDELNINSCAAFSYPIPTAADNCGDAQIRFVSGLGTNASFPIGRSVEVYEARDANGNAVQCEIVINNNPIIDANIQVTDISCHGDVNGSIIAQITGDNAPYTFANVDFGAGLTDLAAGFYTIAIQDNSGCEFMRTVEVKEPDSLLITIVEITDSRSLASGDGAISVEVSGGNSPYSYEWRTEDEVFSSEQNLDLLFVGDYQLFVTDANGCVTNTDSITIDAIVSVNDIDLVAAIKFYPNPVADMLQVELIDHTKKVELIQVFDIMGSEVYQSSSLSSRVDLSHLNQGVYFLQLTFDDHRRLSHQILKTME